MDVCGVGGGNRDSISLPFAYYICTGFNYWATAAQALVGDVVVYTFPFYTYHRHYAIIALVLLGTQYL